MSKEQEGSAFFRKPPKCSELFPTTGNWVWRKRTTKARPPLPTLFFFKKSSEITNNNDVGGGGDVLLSCVTNATTWNTFYHAGYRSPTFAKSIWKCCSFCFTCFCVCIVVYGTSLVILSKYFGADLQMINDKFERTILVNLRLAVLDLGRGYQAEPCWESFP